MKPKLVIFDVDGLLLDTESRWQTAWQMVGEKYGVDNLGTEVFLKCVGRNGKEVEDIILSSLNNVTNPLEILQEARTQGMSLLEERIDLKFGAIELLKYLRLKQIPCSIATATNRDKTMERLKRLNVLEYFDFILCGDEVVYRKPNPEIYQKIIMHYCIEAKEALVLEDSAVGVEAAFRAGIPCIMIPDLIMPNDIQKKQAIKICSNLLDVISLIQ